MQYAYEQFIEISKKLETVRLLNREDLKASYNQLLRDHHPDKNRGQADEGKILLITEAWKKIQSRLKEVAGERPFVDSSAPGDVPSSSAPRGASSSSAEGLRWHVEGVGYNPETETYSRPLGERETVTAEVSKTITRTLVGAKVNPTTGRPVLSEDPIKIIFEFSEGPVDKLILHNDRYTNSTTAYGPIKIEWLNRSSDILQVLATKYYRYKGHLVGTKNRSQKLTVTYRSGDRMEVSGVRLRTIHNKELMRTHPPAIAEMGPDFSLQRKDNRGAVASYSGVSLDRCYNFVATTDSKVKVVFQNKTLENVNVVVPNDAKHGVIVGSRANDSFIRIANTISSQVLSGVDFDFDVFRSGGAKLQFRSSQPDGRLALLPNTSCSYVSAMYSGFQLNFEGKIVKSENTTLELKECSGAVVLYRGLKFHGNVTLCNGFSFNPFYFVIKALYTTIDIEEVSPSGEEKTCYRGVSITLDKNGIKRQLSTGEPFTFTRTTKAVSRQMIGVHCDGFSRFYTPKGVFSTIKTQFYAQDILVLLEGVKIHEGTYTIPDGYLSEEMLLSLPAIKKFVDLSLLGDKEMQIIAPNENRGSTLKIQRGSQVLFECSFKSWQDLYSNLGSAAKVEMKEVSFSNGEKVCLKNIMVYLLDLNADTVPEGYIKVSDFIMKNAFLQGFLGEALIDESQALLMPPEGEESVFELQLPNRLTISVPFTSWKDLDEKISALGNSSKKRKEPEVASQGFFGESQRNKNSRVGHESEHGAGCWYA